MAVARASARELAEKLRNPANAALLAMSIVIYDIIAYRGVAKVEDVLSMCLVPRELCLRALERLAELGIISLKGNEVHLTPIGKRAIELARWGKEL